MAAFPEDIPIGCPLEMTWRNDNVLKEVLDQGNRGYCWNIVASYMISAHLYIHNRVNSLLPLSARHLFGGIDKTGPDGSLKEFETLRNFLVDDGMIVEEECLCVIDKEDGCESSKKKKKQSAKYLKAKADPCFSKIKDKTVYKIRDLIIKEKVDEKELIGLIYRRGPIAVSILIDDEFKLFKGDKIQRGYSERSKSAKALQSHIIYLTGYGTDGEVNYFQFQNSYGIGWGNHGFGKLFRKSSLKRGESSLIKLFFYPELLAN